MVSAEILKKIKHLEIYTRRLLNSSMAGDARSAAKGSGFEFNQIREYSVGDDVRFIDRNSSARMGKLLVKEYVEERSRTIILAVDGSMSGFYSSSENLRFDVIAQIASVLALVAQYGNDAVGLLIFSDKVDCFIPPSKGNHHVRLIMEKLFSFKPETKSTSFVAAFEALAQLKYQHALLVFISDFIDSGYEKKLKGIAKKYDCLALRCIDKFEAQLPDLGFISVEDSETGQHYTVDTRTSSHRNASDFLQARLDEQSMMFKRNHIDALDIALDTPFMPNLIRFFRRRMMY